MRPMGRTTLALRSLAKVLFWLLRGIDAAAPNSRRVSGESGVSGKSSTPTSRPQPNPIP